MVWYKITKIFNYKLRLFFDEQINGFISDFSSWKSHSKLALMLDFTVWLVWNNFFSCVYTWRRGLHVTWKKLWFNLTCDWFLCQLFHWKLLMTTWKYLCNTKLLFLVFSDSSLQKAMPFLLFLPQLPLSCGAVLWTCGQVLLIQ